MRVGATVLAGLVAGLWINLSGMALVYFVLGSEYVHRLVELVPQPTGPGMVIRHLSLRFGFGILCVALYALLRPRVHPATTAALVAAAFLFLLGYVPLSAMLNELGALVGWRLWVSLAWGAGEALVATLLGSYLYERIGA